MRYEGRGGESSLGIEGREGKVDRVGSIGKVELVG